MWTHVYTHVYAHVNTHVYILFRAHVHTHVYLQADAAAARSARLSIPFFTGPHNDAVIECMPSCVDSEHPPKYQAVSALDHLLRKLAVSNV